MNKKEKQYLIYLLEHEARWAGYSERGVWRNKSRRAAYEALRNIAACAGVSVPIYIEEHGAYTQGLAAALLPISSSATISSTLYSSVNMVRHAS